jgi:hypothetical protein
LPTVWYVKSSDFFGSNFLTSSNSAKWGGAIGSCIENENNTVLVYGFFICGWGGWAGKFGFNPGNGNFMELDAICEFSL